MLMSHQYLGWSRLMSTRLQPTQMIVNISRTRCMKSISQYTASTAGVTMRSSNILRTMSLCTKLTARLPPPQCSPFLQRPQIQYFSSEKNLVSIVVPAMGDSITEGTISEWIKKTGDYVAADDIVCVLETDKVSVDVRTHVAGTVSHTLAEVDDVVQVGAELFRIEEGVGEASVNAQPEHKEEEEQQQQQQDDTPNTSSTSHSSSNSSSSTATAKAETAASSPASSSTSKAQTTIDLSKPGIEGSAPLRSETRVPLSRMRQRIAQRLKEAQNTAASLTTFNEVDMSKLIQMRSTFKEEFLDTHNVKLGFMSAFVKASVAALIDQPAVNSYIEENQVVYHDYCDVSVAVSTPTGLVVPVIRNCETLSFAGIEKTIVELGKKAREGKIALEDMSGGTFTISNGGVYGSLFGTPILNPPQSAILGMHGTFQRPIALNGEVVIRPMMYIALTYDHRIVDGREAVTFLKKVKEHIEDPHRMLLGL